jgi:SHS2 domain-containing protein
VRGGASVTEEGRRYDLVAATADVAIRARGGSLPELLANAAWGMMDLVCDSATVEPVRTWEVEVSADDVGTLMVDLLTDLLVLLETEGALLSSIEVEVSPGGPPWTAVARMAGETFDRDRHEVLHDVKAVTYHTLEVLPEEGYAHVLLDI